MIVVDSDGEQFMNQLIASHRSASYEAGTLAILRMVFDEVWASVAPDFGDDLGEIEDARIRLATIVLGLAKNHQLGPMEIVRTARHLLHQARTASKTSQ